MCDDVDRTVRRLRARRGEIEEAIFAGVRDVVSVPVGDGDVEYVAGLRAAVIASVEYCLSGIEREGEPCSSIAIPIEAVAQARRAARNGVSLDVVLRRYMVGQAILSDYVLEEAGRVGLGDSARSGLRGMLRMLAALLDELVVTAAREYVGELRHAGHSRERRLLERVQLLLAGESVHDPRLGYGLEAEHLAVIARGTQAEEALRSIAHGVGRRLLMVQSGTGTVWAWLGGQRRLAMADLERVLSRTQLGVELSLAVGEPARGLQGWRLTHRQAQEALLVALRRPRQLTRYGEVALLAAALRDDALSGALIEVYVAPLEDSRGGGPALLQTLRAYLAAERNVSSAAIALQVARSTVVNRLRTIEERLGRPLHPCPAELQVALQLDELGAPTRLDPSADGSYFT